MLHSILDIKDFNQLLGQPFLGQSWEAFAIENILSELSDWNGYYFRTSNGAEIDLIMERGREKMAIEFKASSNPKVKPGTISNLEILDIYELWVITPTEDEYDLKKNIHITGLESFIRKFN